MGSRARNEREKEELKKKIRQAATELIIQEGYEQLSMRKLAARIGYTPTTIYLYYKNKADIIRDMEEALFSQLMQELAELMARLQEHSADQLVKQCILTFIHCFTREPEMVRAVMYSGSERIFGTDESIAGIPENEGLQMMDVLIERGISEGVFREAMQKTSWMLTASILGFLMSAIEGRLYEQKEFMQTAEAYADMLLKGMCL